MIKMSMTSSVRRIAILNCYLQAGLKKIAETEAAKRFEEAAKGMGIEVQVFAKSEQLYEFRPDLVICHAYQDAKLTQYPTYGTLTMPTKWVSHVSRFQRNIFSYDAYIGISDSVDAYVGELVKPSGKQLPHAYCAFSVPRTSFVPADYSKAFAAYLGTNWDGGRHGSFFSLFEDTSLLKCYGPRKNWRYLHKSTYGGPVPFDGKTVLKIYHNAGIGLCLNQRDFDEAGIPTSRIFEIPASSAVIIAGQNPLIKNIYGDSALYVDVFNTPHDIFLEVKDKIEWVRSHPKIAAEMAEESHRIFSEKLSMEVFLQNLLTFHAQHFYNTTQVHIGHTTVIVPCGSASFSRVAETIESLSKQNLKPKEVVLVKEKPSALWAKFFSKDYEVKLNNITQQYKDTLNIRVVVSDTASAFNQRFCSVKDTVLKESISGDFVLVAREGDVFFPPHLKSLEEHASKAQDLCHSGVVERSRWRRLPEIIHDQHPVVRKEHMRLSHFTSVASDEVVSKCHKFNMGAMLVPTPLFKQTLADAYDFPSLLRALYAGRRYQFIPEVTMQSMYQRNINLPFFKP